MAESDLVLWIQGWLLNQCDGRWEHSFGIKIETLDNPGWSVVVDLSGTDMERAVLAPVAEDHAADNWWYCSIDDGQFKGYGGPENLRDILSVFRGAVESDQFP